MKKALFYGILASAFFAFTFIFNRSMNLGGGYWLWGAALRYVFMLPLLFLIVWQQGRNRPLRSRADTEACPETTEYIISDNPIRHDMCRPRKPALSDTLAGDTESRSSGHADAQGGLRQVHQEIRQHPGTWLLWSTVGFGLFYMPLSMASVYGESWFVAATWQITIVCGVLLTPLFGQKIPLRNLLFSCVILAGIFLLQLSSLDGMQTSGVLTALLLIVIAGFAYPLGNRKMLQHMPAGMTTVQRVYGMTLCSMPFWTVCMLYAAVTHGGPTGGQAVQSLIVAVFSGVIATLLFFEATNLVRQNPRQLAVVEATQAGEVLFTLLGGILFLGDDIPTPAGFAGIAVIIIGMVANSLSGSRSA